MKVSRGMKDMDNEKYEPGKTLIIRDEGDFNKHYKFDNLKEFLKFSLGESFVENTGLGDNKPIPENMNYHERAVSGFPQKFKFDFDHCPGEEEFVECLESILCQFQETYGFVPEYDVFDSSGPTKFSRHVIFQALAADEHELDYFTKNILKNSISDIEYSYLDDGINKGNQCLRAVFSAKDGRIKLPTLNLGDSFEPETYESFSQTREWHNLTRAFFTLYDDKMKIVNGVAPAREIKEITNAKIEQKHIDIIKKKIDMTQWAFISEEESTNRLRFTRIKPGLCEICKRVHTSSNMYILVFEGKIFMGCYRNSDKKHILLYKEEEQLPDNVQIQNNAQAVNEWFDAEFIKNKIEFGHIGLSDIYKEYSKNNICLLDNTIYKFNNTSGIWEKTTFKELEIGRALGSIIKKYQDTRPIMEHEIIEKIKKYCYSARCHTDLSKLINFKKIESFNCNHDLIPLRNKKVVNIKTGEVSELLQEYYFNYFMDFDYIQENAEEIKTFFADLFPRKDVAEYMRVLLGYSITNLNKVKKIWICHGSGNNGKSLLFNLMSEIFTGFTSPCSENLLIESNVKVAKNSHSAHIFAIKNKRMVFLPECGGKKLDSNLVKSISGGDIIQARACGEKNAEEIKIVSKIFLPCNNLVEWDESDKALCDRLQFIPFEQIFVDEPQGNQKKRDPDLYDKLTGVLKSKFASFIINGAIEYFKSGLPTCQTIIENSEKEVKINDTVSQFLNDQCQFSGTIKKADLYNYYADWCKENAVKFIPKKEFHQSMNSKGFSEYKSSTYIYRNLSLKFTESGKLDHSPEAAGL